MLLLLLILVCCTIAIDKSGQQMVLNAVTFARVDSRNDSDAIARDPAEYIRQYAGLQ